METTYLTAEKAREIVKALNKLECILDNVYRKALKGEMRLLIEEGGISPGVITVLQEFGYRIKKLETGNLYAIEWCEDD